MGIPIGTEYLISIVVDHDSVAYNATGFLLQVDLSHKYDNIISYINDSSNIAIYDFDNDIECTKRIDIIGTKIYVYFLADISTTQDSTYYLCAGKGVTSADTATIFSGYGYANRWSFNESTDTTVADTAGSSNGEIIAPAYKNNSGFFGKCLTNTYGILDEGRVQFSSPVIPIIDITIEAIVKFNAFNKYYTILYTDSFVLANVIMSNSLGLKSGGNLRASSLEVLQPNVWTHILVSRNSEGIAKFYINGIDRTNANNSGTPDISTTNLIMANSGIGLNRDFNGSLDEVSIYSSINDANFALNRYRSLFDTDFIHLGSGYALHTSEFYRYLYRIHY